MNAWYDLSTAPNIELFNHVRNNASEERIRESQYLIVAPHRTLPQCTGCATRTSSVRGTWARVHFDFDDIVYDFFDLHLKGESDRFP